MSDRIFIEENYELVDIQSINGLMDGRSVYDLEVDEDHTYTLANRLISHNSRAKAGKSMFKEITRFCGRYKVTMVYTNHVYKDTASAKNPAYAKNKQSGGNQPTYMSTGVIFLTKSAEKDADKQITGNFLRAKSEKNRLVPEGKQIEMYLSFKMGPNRYYGLLEQAVEAGVAKQGSNSKNFIIPHVHGKQLHIQKIYGELREKVFCKEFLDKINDYCMKNYVYSAVNDEDAYIERIPDEDEDGDEDE